MPQSVITVHGLRAVEEQQRAVICNLLLCYFFISSAEVLRRMRMPVCLLDCHPSVFCMCTTHCVNRCVRLFVTGSCSHI